MTIRILLLEDSDLDAELIALHLRRGDIAHATTRVTTREDYVAALSGEYDLILADYSLPSFDGLTALTIAHERTPETPFIFVSGTLGEEIAIESFKRGATDYVLKQRLVRLPAAVTRALAEAKEKTERQQAERNCACSWPSSATASTTPSPSSSRSPPTPFAMRSRSRNSRKASWRAFYPSEKPTIS